MSTEQVKPGDLAVIVGSRNVWNHGMLVEVGEAIAYPAETPATDVHGEVHRYNVDKPAFWITTTGRLLKGVDGTAFTCGPCASRFLRPIRNPPGQDETLRWADVPRNDYADAGFMPLGD